MQSSHDDTEQYGLGKEDGRDPFNAANDVITLGLVQDFRVSSIAMYLQDLPMLITDNPADRDRQVR